MWVVQNSDLPETALSPQNYGAGLCAVLRADLGNQFGALAQTDFGLTLAQQDPVSLSLSIPAAQPVPGSADLLLYTVAVNRPVATASRVQVAGRVYTPAPDLNAPQSGQYVYDPYTQQLQLYTRTPIPQGITVQLLGGIPREEIPTRAVPPPYPDFLYFLPVTGSLTWTRGLEQHPSGQLNIRVRGDKLAEAKALLRVGAQLDLYGVPLRFGPPAYVEKPRSIYPAQECQISLPLSGAWEIPLERPIFLRSDGKNLAAQSAPYTDPACQNPQIVSFKVSTGATNANTTVATLAKRVNCAYVGPELAVAIPSDTPQDATTTVGNEFTARLRQANCFAFYSNPKGIEARRSDQVRLWNYPETSLLTEVQQTIQAVDRKASRRFSPRRLLPPVPDPANFPVSPVAPPALFLRAEDLSLIPYGAEYDNYAITGQFSENPLTSRTETTYGAAFPVGKNKAPERITRKQGSLDPDLPPFGSASLRTLDSNFDANGPRHTLIERTTENGSPISEKETIWGFAYLASDIVNDDGEMTGDAYSFWRIISSKETTYEYDSSTRYLLSSSTTGCTLARFKTENATEPETLYLDPTEDAADLAVYQFFQQPIFQKTCYKLKSFASTYKNYQAPQEETETVCAQNGTSYPAAKAGQTPPEMFCEVESTESVSFASMTDPEAQPDDDPKLPPLILGEESRFRRFITVIPGDPNLKTADRFDEYTESFKAQEPMFVTGTLDFNFTENDGRPGVHTQKAEAPEEEEQPEDPTGPANNPVAKRYFVSTPGYSTADPVGGSLNYPHAKTFEQALTAARTDLYLRNIQNTLREQLVVPFNPNLAEGDRFTYPCNGELRQRVILQISHELKFLGPVDGIPQVTGQTSLTLGLDRTPPITSSSIAPSGATFKNADGSPYIPSGLPKLGQSSDSLGEILPLIATNRRNF